MPDEFKMQDDGNESDLEFELEVHPVDDGAEPPNDGRKAVDPREALGNKTKQRVSVAGEDVKRRFKARLFSLNNNRMKKSAINLAAPASRSFDYEEMYQEDEYGKEAFPEARVWKVHNDETQLFDQERVDAWRDALDVLLVFIGLFSAIVTTFVVQTSQSLQPDYAQMTVIVALEILRTMTNSSIPTTTLSSISLNREFGQATPSPTDKVVNGLWFTSLAVSLSTALLTVLTKQWLYHYTTSTSGTSRERARIRQFRYGGLEAYRVPLIIDLLPILLHLALALFLVGLTIFLTPLHKGIAGIVGSIMALSYVLYIISVYLPIRDPRCPYKSPLSFYAYWLYHGAIRRVKRIIARPSSIFVVTPMNIIHAMRVLPSKIPRPTHSSITTLHPQIMRHASSTLQSVRSWASNEQKGTPATLSIAETVEVQHGGNQLDVDAIVYLCNNSSNSTVRTIAMEAFGGLAPSDADIEAVCKIVDTNLSAMLNQYAEVKGRGPNVAIPTNMNMLRKMDRLLRAPCVGFSGRLSKPFTDTRAFTNLLVEGSDTEDGHFFRNTLFPSLFPLLFSSTPPAPFGPERDLPAALAGCQHYNLPLTVWAAAIRVASCLWPTDSVIRTVLLSVLHNLSVEDAEMGAVTLNTAIQHPLIRHLALDYLHISEVETEDLTLLFLHSFHDLLCEDDVTPDSLFSKRFWRISRQFDMLSPLFATLAWHLPDWVSPTAHQNLPHEQTALIRLILQLSSESSPVYEIPWKALKAAIQPFTNPEHHTLANSLTTPSWIYSVLHRFRPISPSDNLFGGDTYFEVSQNQGTIRQVVKELETLLPLCQGAELAEAILHSIHKLDMLPSCVSTPGTLLKVDLFWSPRMVRMFVGKVFSVKRSQGSCPEWFNELLLLIHAPERLIFLCRQLLLCTGHRWGSFLDVLCRIEPHHSNWPTTFETLLPLLEDQSYLNGMVDDFGGAVWNPRQRASKELRHAKRLLKTHHPILRESRFDIPQFDHDDNLITVEQLLRESDDILEDTAPLRGGNCADSDPAPSSSPSSAMMHPIHNPQSHDLPSPDPSSHPDPAIEVGLVDLDNSPTSPLSGERLELASNEIAHEVSRVVDGLSPHVIIEIDSPTTEHARIPPEDLAASPASESQLQLVESEVERGEGGGSG